MMMSFFELWGWSGLARIIQLEGDFNDSSASRRRISGTMVKSAAKHRLTKTVETVRMSMP